MKFKLKVRKQAPNEFDRRWRLEARNKEDMVLSADGDTLHQAFAALGHLFFEEYEKEEFYSRTGGL